MQRYEHGGSTAVLGPLSRERVVDTRALAFLAEASAVLASSLDYEATLQRVAGWPNAPALATVWLGQN